MVLNDTALVASQEKRGGLEFLRLDSESMFNVRQQEALAEYEPPIAQDTSASYPATLYVILKATRLCNLRCSYCHAWREGPDQVLPFERLLDVIAQSMRLPGIKWLHIVWHGGETTLLSHKYFQRAIWLQEYFRVDDRKVGHSIQTNATRIDDGWASFFRDVGFSVGVSLDIDSNNHNRSRVFKDGSGSFAATIAGIRRLKANNVRYGILAVIDAQVIASGAKALLSKIEEQGITIFGMLNALPANNNEPNDRQPYLDWEAYVDFLRDVFQEWRENYREKMNIRELESLYQIVQGSNTRLCIFQGTCMGQYLTIEPDGRVSACDKYVGDEAHCFGDLRKETLFDILSTSSTLEASRKRAETSLSAFSGCRNFVYCRGGCPHDAQLNVRHKGARDCCGLSVLIEDMKLTADRERAHG